LSKRREVIDEIEVIEVLEEIEEIEAMEELVVSELALIVADKKVQGSMLTAHSS